MQTTYDLSGHAIRAYAPDGTYCKMYGDGMQVAIEYEADRYGVSITRAEVQMAYYAGPKPGASRLDQIPVASWRPIDGLLGEIVVDGDPKELDRLIDFAARNDAEERDHIFRDDHADWARAYRAEAL